MEQSQFDELLTRACDLQRPLTPSDRDTTFADLGVDSLTQLAVLVEVEERFGREIGPDEIASGELGTPHGLWRFVATVDVP